MLFDSNTNFLLQEGEKYGVLDIYKKSQNQNIFCLNANAKEFDINTLFKRKEHELLAEVIEYDNFLKCGKIKLINNEECFFNHEDFVYINDEINENIKKGYFLLVHPIYRFFDSNEYYIWTISKKEKTLKNCNNIRPIKCQQCNGFGHFSFNCKKK